MRVRTASHCPSKVASLPTRSQRMSRQARGATLLFSGAGLAIARGGDRRASKSRSDWQARQAARGNGTTMSHSRGSAPALGPCPLSFATWEASSFKHRAATLVLSEFARALNVPKYREARLGVSYTIKAISSSGPVGSDLLEGTKR